MEHDAFIDSLGGTGALAVALGQNDSTVSMWRQRGIPWRWRPAIAAIAEDANKPVPDGFLDPQVQARVA